MGLHFHHLVSVHDALDKRLYIPIELHEDHIGGIGQQQTDTLPVRDVVIQEENDEHNEADNVEEDVPKQRPPR